jgi:monofunctional biosynthetic peptidoglycan transglycosylase
LDYELKLKAIILLPILLITVLLGVGLVGFMYVESKAESLLTHFPVWNLEKKSYELVKKKPKSWIGINKISKVAKGAIVISEDWAFNDHNGLDLNQLRIVVEESWKEKRLVRGASTITQQVVKNSLLSNERSLVRKAQEMMLSLSIEKKMSKDRILEYYLNLIELGEDTYGIKNASYKYFHKHPSNLTAKEGAFLAMLLPSPVKYSQSFKERKLTDFGKEQVSNILIKMRQARIITEEDRLREESVDLSFERLQIEEAIDEDILSIDNESYD